MMYENILDLQNGQHSSWHVVQNKNVPQRRYLVDVPNSLASLTHSESGICAVTVVAAAA